MLKLKAEEGLVRRLVSVSPFRKEHVIPLPRAHLKQVTPSQLVNIEVHIPYTHFY